jgi:hypothetical protein
MTTRLWWTYVVRWQGGTLATLAVVHAILVTWAAWYVAEAWWSSAPVGVSPTPLAPVAFQGSWIMGSLYLLGVGPAIGFRAVRGPWVGADPTATLPLGRAGRALSAWGASTVLLTVVALAPLPTYLVLFEMGAFTVSDLTVPLFLHFGVIVAGPIMGVGMALRRPRSLLEGTLHV